MRLHVRDSQAGIEIQFEGEAETKAFRCWRDGNSPLTISMARGRLDRDSPVDFVISGLDRDDITARSRQTPESFMENVRQSLAKLQAGESLTAKAAFDNHGRLKHEVSSTNSNGKQPPITLVFTDPD